MYEREDEGRPHQLPPGLLEDLPPLWRPALSAEPDLVCAYLFGSALKRAWVRDLDVAVVLHDRHRFGLSLRARLVDALERALPIALPVDVRALSAEDDPVFAFEVLRDGRRLHENDRPARVRFEATVLTRYHDLEPVLAHARAGLRRRLGGGRG